LLGVRLGLTLKQIESEKVELTSQTIEFCRRIAGSSEIVAVTIVDNYPSNASAKRPIQEILLIIRNCQPRVMRYFKTFKDKTIFVLAVDQWIFERDVTLGFLGEAIASKLIFPHTTIEGEPYLKEKEVTLKKRLILELLENLVVNYPELAQTVVIKPQYFMYEVFSNRIRVFPLIAYDLSKLTSWLLTDEEKALESYIQALEQLETEEKISTQNGHVTITRKFIHQCKDPKIKLVNLSKNMPRTLFTAILGVLPQLLNVVSENTETFLRTQRINWIRQPDAPCTFIDPQKYVFFPTSEGLMSLSDKVDIKGFIEKMLLKGENAEIQIKPVGGMLNDVYLINAKCKDVENKVLAKRFKDWSGLKWFPLMLWSFGARSFAVSGQARLSKETAISEFLRNEGFNVPKILHVSNVERIVFMEFIEGESLSEVIKRFATSTDPQTATKVIDKVTEVGEIYAAVHSHNVALGDTKPDNTLVKSDGTLVLIDFEQATKGGDQAWDIAVFLYYSGHYLQPFSSNTKTEVLANAFISGYLKAGGNILNIKKAGAQKYTRVFSIFTLPPAIRTISKICRKIGQEGEKKLEQQEN
jgi:tRNA A-37 threonylcarbamoyl transferase component Bud32